MPTKLPDDAIYYVAFFNGFWPSSAETPGFELWTLRVTLSPTLIAGGSYARETIEAFLHPEAVAA